VTKSGHRVTLVDTSGQEAIAMATPKSNRLVMTEKTNETGRPAVVLHTDGDIILAAPKGRIHLQSKLQSKEVGAGGSPAKAAAAPAAKQIAAAKPSTDEIKWVRYKGSPTPCSKYDRMPEEEKKHATAKDKEKTPGGPAYTTVGAPLSNYQNWQQDGIVDAHKCVIQVVLLADDMSGGYSK
jgi:hypothetical protein